jgi:cytidylate kinase
MPIITISRGSGSGGQLLAEALGETLGYEVVSREEVVHEAAAF